MVSSKSKAGKSKEKRRKTGASHFAKKSVDRRQVFISEKHAKIKGDREDDRHPKFTFQGKTSSKTLGEKLQGQSSIIKQTNGKHVDEE